MIYLLILIFALTGVIAHDFRPHAHERTWRRLYWVFTAMVILCVGLRKHLGTDYVVHGARLMEALSPSELFSSPYFFLRNRFDLLLYPLKMLGEPASVIAFQFIFCSLLTIPFARFILRQTRYWFSCYLLFFITIFTALEFEVVFQGAAVGIFLLAWTDLRAGRYLPYSLKIILACFFHFSALMMLLLPLCLNHRMARKIANPKLFPVWAVVVIGGCLLVPVWGPWADRLADLLPVESYFGFFLRRISYYSSHVIFRAALALNWKGWIGFTAAYVAVPTAIYYLFYYYRRDSYLLPVVALSALFSIGTMGMELFMRLNFYLLPAVYAAIMSLCPARDNNILSIKTTLTGDIRSTAARRLIWLAILSPMLFFHINKYRVRMWWAPDTPAYAAYYPYYNWIANQDTSARDSISGTYYIRSGERDSIGGMFYKNQLNEKPEKK